MPPPSRRPASPWLLVVAFVAYSLAHLFNNTVLQQDGPRLALERLQAASGGWIEPVLVRAQVVLAVFLVVVVGFGRRRPADIGMKARHVKPALGVYVGAWVLLQGFLVAAALVRHHPLALHPMWARFGVAAVLGGVVAQGLGHALVEDMAFRGFFMPELRARFARPGVALALVGALSVGASALLFGLAHLPTRALTKGSGLAELVVEQGHFLSAGLAFGLAYLVTRNLFVVVALHVLLNDPAPLFDAPGAVLNRCVLAVFAVVLIVTAVSNVRRWARRRATRDAELDDGARRTAA